MSCDGSEVGWEKVSSVGLEFFLPLFHTPHISTIQVTYNTYKIPSLVGRSSPLMTTLGLKSKHLIIEKFQASILGLASAIQELASNCNDVRTAIYAHIIHARTEHRRTQVGTLCRSSHTAHSWSQCHHADCSHGVVQGKLQYIQRCPLHE